MRTRLLLAALAVLPIAAGAQNTDSRWSWTGNVGDGRWVRVASINGPIEVTASSDGRVHVTAEKRWTRGDPRQVRFEVVEHNGNVTICALWQPNARCDEDGMHSEGRNGRNRGDVAVHFAVALPPQANVAPTTINGAIRVTGARRAVRATTVNGNVEVGTSGGPVTATTVNGNIRASMGAIGTSDLIFTTVNGAVDVAVPRDASADVSLSTVHGAIASDFPITVSGRWGPRSASGRIGSGGPDLRMSTVNGSLALRSN